MRFDESMIGNVFIAKVLESRITTDVSSRFKQDLIEFVTKGHQLIVLDLSDVIFIDSSGLGAIMGSLKAMGSEHELVLCGAREAVSSVFRLTRMNKVLRMFPTQEEAVSALA